jgi:hypothetical protein
VSSFCQFAQTCTAQEKWAKFLPTILLGLRAVPRDKSSISAAEMTFGEKLRLPGKFFENGSEITNKTEFVRRLQTTFCATSPLVIKKVKNNKKPFIFKDLFSTEKVYLRVD